MGLKSAFIDVLKYVLPLRVKNSLVHLSFNLARPEFDKFSYEYALAPNMKWSLAAMAKRGFAPNTIIDVGAFEGAWSKMAKSIWPRCQVIMIEPNPAKREVLATVAEETSARVLHELLGSENDGQATFYVMESGSSILNERSAVPRKGETRHLRTLDSLLNRVGRPCFLKIDAQGYELEILQGAAETLQQTDAVLLEVALIEINEGAPLLHEVISFMHCAGFVAYDIVEFHRRPLDRALNQIDIIFVRPTSPLISDKRHFA